MGLGDFTSDDDESSSANKSTYITFKNPRTADDIPEGSEHRHQEEYYDAAQEMRNKLGQDINVPVGRFLHAAVEADDGNNEPLEELFEQLTN